MKFLDYVKKSIIREKGNIFIMLLFFVSTLALLISFAYRDTFKHQFDMTFKYNVAARSLLVGPSNDVIRNMTPEEFCAFEYDFESIRNIEHVDAVTESTSAVSAETDFLNSKYDGQIGIDYANENIVKSLTGEALFGYEDYGVAICPKNFSPVIMIMRIDIN